MSTAHRRTPSPTLTIHPAHHGPCTPALRTALPPPPASVPHLLTMALSVSDWRMLCNNSSSSRVQGAGSLAVPNDELNLDRTPIINGSRVGGLSATPPNLNVNIDPTATRLWRPMEKIWRHTAAFCLVRPSPHHRPQYPPTQDLNSKPVTSLVRQATEYARMHLSARPFLLFSVALSIF
ncbi:hypothetical protein BJ912DRAFT_1092409 [Pholiota molesta]|nr:hypothetical protein BJ912DRAFT_1092409 [Pholiota molesta]